MESELGFLLEFLLSNAESMWQLSLRGTEPYPERPGVPDCVYYMRTGICGYGNRCRYNHPRNRAAVNFSIIFINNWGFPFVYLISFEMFGSALD